MSFSTSVDVCVFLRSLRFYIHSIIRLVTCVMPLVESREFGNYMLEAIIHQRLLCSMTCGNFYVPEAQFMVV